MIWHKTLNPYLWSILLKSVDFGQASLLDEPTILVIDSGSDKISMPLDQFEAIQTFLKLNLMCYESDSYYCLCTSESVFPDIWLTL